MDVNALTNRPKVFLSHSSLDADLARRLALDLESANLKVWFDQWHLGVGDEIVPGIEKGVDEADFVVVLITSASVASDWVEREWRQKFIEEARTKRVSIVPVRGENCEMPDFLAQRSHADIAGGSYALGLVHLLEMLHHHVPDADIRLPEQPPERPVYSNQMIPIVTPVALEVGRALIPLVNGDGSSRFLSELLPQMRMRLHAEFGFAFPGVRIRGAESEMPPNAALIMIDAAIPCLKNLLDAVPASKRRPNR